MLYQNTQTSYMTRAFLLLIFLFEFLCISKVRNMFFTIIDLEPIISAVGTPFACPVMRPIKPFRVSLARKQVGMS